MAKSIMIQGTASSVGKSVITAGICRLLKQDGYTVAPFKSQNMALNSYITAKGHEMGRAQVVQAEAAGIEPDVRMNPILLKPSTDQKAQVIVNGVVYRNMSASEYHQHKPSLKEMVRETYRDLASEVDFVVIEGAGSPAEINLREGDLVNMGMAELSDSPVLLVGDIDRGGVFASLYGTVMLLEPEERKRVIGLIINKFRGDLTILEPGLKMIEDLVGIPVLGVLPYTDIKIEDEDSLAERFRNKSDARPGADLLVEVLYLPHVSNFTDFHFLEAQEDVHLRYVMRGEALGEPDLLILPGSKNTIEDLIYLHRSGLAEQILKKARKGTQIIGICGGFQMLGNLISDPHGTESSVASINGLGLLQVETVFETQKTTTQAKGRILDHTGMLEPLSNLEVSGYEIHMGKTTLGPDEKPFLTLTETLGKAAKITDGAINASGNVFGTYLHGILDHHLFVRGLLDGLRKKKGLDAYSGEALSLAEMKEREYDRLAALLRTHIDWTRVKALVDAWPGNR